MTVGLTQVQSDALQFIRSHCEKNGIGPSYDEIARHLGVNSKAGVHRVIHALQERGKITKLHRRARSIWPIEEGQNATKAIQTVLAECNVSENVRLELEAILARGAQT